MPLLDLRVRKAKSGDQAAFEELVREHQTRIYNICLRTMGNPEDALDMAQETLLKAWRALPTFQGTSSLSTWLYRVAVNTCLDELRRRKKAQQVSVEALAESGWEPEDPDSAEKLDAALRKGLLQEALASLPDEYRAALVLRDVQGFSYEEIAEILDCPIGTVRSRLNRARRQMAKKLLELEPSFMETV